MLYAVASLCVGSMSYLIYTEAKKLPNFLLNKLVQRFSLKLNHSILKIVVDLQIHLLQVNVMIGYQG